MRNPLLLAAALAAAPGCAEPGAQADTEAALLARLAAGPWVDLSYEFSSETVYWPTGQPFTLYVSFAGTTPAGYYYTADSFAADSHGGTHIDAPLHFAQGRHSVEQVPLERGIGPAAVIDVSEQAQADPDLLIGVDALERWEARHGRIPDGAIVLFRTGWGSRWPDRARYLGTDQGGEPAIALLHFPGLAPEAARWLLEQRAIGAVGIDTASIDRGQSTTYEAHQILLGAQIPAFENVANLDQLPERGSFVVALPMKIKGASGGPLRIAALLPPS